MMNRMVRMMLTVIGGILAAAALAVLIGLGVKLLWNWLMPGIFGLPEISYWQSVGLLILGHLLFGGGHTVRHSREHRKSRGSGCGDGISEDRVQKLEVGLG